MRKGDAGQAFYGAPETLTEDPAYTAKSDIWSFGCILFEIASQKIAFREDSDVQEYAVSPRPWTILPIGNKPDGDSMSVPSEFEMVDSLINQMLRNDPNQRPSALSLLKTFGGRRIW